jgi:putative peptidoglycan binding protein
MSRRRTLLAVLPSVIAAALFTVGPATSASAATPQCNQALDALPDSAAGGIWVPIAANGSSNCWMARGNYSGGVWALQRALRFCYGQNIAVDSDYGPRTEAALYTVQGWIGARQDGGYGPETASKIKFSSINTDDASACAWR